MNETPSDSFRDGLIHHIPDLRAFARALIGERSAADDLVQETLLRAWDKSSTFRAGTNLRAWLFVILRNQYYSQGRRRAREVEDPEGALVASLTQRAGQEGSVALAELRAALTELPDEQREALVLVGAAGMSHEEARTRIRLRDRHHEEPRLARPGVPGPQARPEAAETLAPAAAESAQRLAG